MKEEKVILNSEQFAQTLKRICSEILKRIERDNSLFIGIYRGGAYLTTRIQKYVEEELGEKIPHGFLDINLYRDDLSRIGYHPVVRKTELPSNIDDKLIFLIDDVLFTGRTVRSALDALIDFGRPKKVLLCVMADRGGRELPIQADICGVRIDAKDDEIVDVRFKEIHGKDEVVLRKK